MSDEANIQPEPEETAQAEITRANAEDGEQPAAEPEVIPEPEPEPEADPEPAPAPVAPRFGTIKDNSGMHYS